MLIIISVASFSIIQETLHKLRFSHLKQEVRVAVDMTIDIRIKIRIRLLRLQAFHRRRQRRTRVVRATTDSPCPENSTAIYTMLDFNISAASPACKTPRNGSFKSEPSVSKEN